MRSIDGTLELMDIDNNDKKTTIGTFEVALADLEGAMNERESFFDVMDTTSTACDYYGVLFDENDDFKPSVRKAVVGGDYIHSPNLLMLDRLVIYPTHRGNGYGLLALQALVQRFRIGMGVVAMKPYPLQYEVKPRDEAKIVERAALQFDTFKGDKAQATRKLKNYYAKLGFKNLPRTEYMVRDPSKPFGN